MSKFNRELTREWAAKFARAFADRLENPGNFLYPGVEPRIAQAGEEAVRSQLHDLIHQLEEEGK